MKNFEKATFGAGCFWCSEAVFARLEGVKEVVSGYAGGAKESPTYKEVSSGDTGHAEVVEITYDPQKISYDQLLEVFWNTHDPTTPDRQGNDVGSQYRSVIFYHTDQQKRIAKESKEKLEQSGKYNAPIVTQILPYKSFFKAEGYHQDYYEKNQGAPYCQLVIQPKIEKLEKQFKEKLKDNYLELRN